METLRCPRCGSDEELHLAVNYQSFLPLPAGAVLKMAQIAVGPELLREEKLICNQCEYVGTPDDFVDGRASGDVVQLAGSG